MLSLDFGPMIQRAQGEWKGKEGLNGVTTPFRQVIMPDGGVLPKRLINPIIPSLFTTREEGDV